MLWMTDSSFRTQGASEEPRAKEWHEQFAPYFKRLWNQAEDGNGRRRGSPVVQGTESKWLKEMVRRGQIQETSGEQGLVKQRRGRRKHQEDSWLCLGWLHRESHTLQETHKAGFKRTRRDRKLGFCLYWVWRTGETQAERSSNRVVREGRGNGFGSHQQVGGKVIRDDELAREEYKEHSRPGIKPWGMQTFKVSEDHLITCSLNNILIIIWLPT